MSERGEWASRTQSDLVKETTTEDFIRDVMEESRQQPVLVQFWAPGREPCQKLTPILEKIIYAADRKAKLVRLNIDRYPEIPNRTAIQTVPTVIGLIDGKVFDAFAGLVSESEAASFLDRLIRNHPRQKQDFQRKSRARNNSAEDTAGIGGQTGNGETSDATAVVNITEQGIGGSALISFEGREFRMKIPENAHDGQRFRLRGQGSQRADGTRGDLYVVINFTAAEGQTPGAAAYVSGARSQLRQLKESGLPAASITRQLVKFSYEHLIAPWNGDREASGTRIQAEKEQSHNKIDALKSKLEAIAGGLEQRREARRSALRAAYKDIGKGSEPNFASDHSLEIDEHSQDDIDDVLHRLEQRALNAQKSASLVQGDIRILMPVLSIIAVISSVIVGINAQSSQQSALWLVAVGLFLFGVGYQLLWRSFLKQRYVNLLNATLAFDTVVTSQIALERHRTETQIRDLEKQTADYEAKEAFALKGLHRDKFIPVAQEIEKTVAQIVDTLGCAAASWQSDLWSHSTTSDVAQGGARFGKFLVGENSDFTSEIPALMAFGKGKSLLFKVHSAGDSASAVSATNAIITRLLGSISPGKINFTFIDPVGLGQNVASFLALADYDPKLVTHQAWTETRQIEDRLSDLTAHMATVLQKRLRQNYQDIDDYNGQAGVLHEPYRVVVVVDFPEQFSESAARQLQRIVQNGPRCGVYAIVVASTSKAPPYGFGLGDLEPHCDVVDSTSVFSDPTVRGATLVLDDPPPNALVTRIAETVGETAPQGVAVPFGTLLQMAKLSSETLWTGNSTEELRIPVGQFGDLKVQYLSLGGSGTAHHALVVGRPGSGKSNLMHVIITAATRYYSPDQLVLYLVDFKKGVEFKAYAEAKLPHAKVIAVESEREFGLSVLQGLDEEMNRRGDAFRTRGVASIADFRRKANQVCPRHLLLVDEFQEFFTQDDQIGREASLLLDRLVRQGRAFGIHVMLGSQTLAGSYSLARSTLDQMAVRIALQCSDADSRLILADDNPAARQLTRPGEGVYNAANGLEEGNNIFQVALLTEQERQHQMTEIGEWARRNKITVGPIVFEGHEPALLSACLPLRNVMTGTSPSAVGSADPIAWLGEPLAIRPPTMMQFRRQSGVNLLVVSRDEKEASGVLFAATLSLAAQHNATGAKIYFLDLSSIASDGSSAQEALAELLPEVLKLYRQQRDLQNILPELADVVVKRQNDRKAPVGHLYLIILGLHRARDLRQEDGGLRLRSLGKEERGPNLPDLFATIVRDGPEVGVHVLVWSDSYASLSRALDRQSLREFGVRVVGAMNSQDSMYLLDDAAASKIDRPHRLIKADETIVGVLEAFRPYALPSINWVRKIAAALLPRS
jgi:thiol-disulfide isomerase/thioredoxin